MGINYMNLCECGCRSEVKRNNRFLRGHGGHSLEARSKQSIAHKKRYENPKEREKLSLAMKLACSTEEARKKKSEAAKKAFNTPEMRERRSQISKVIQNLPDIKKKMCAIQKVVQNRPEVKLKHSQTAKIVNNCLSKRLAHSRFMKERMGNQTFKEIFVTVCNRSETKRKQSKNQKENWEDSDYVKKQMRSRGVGQNNKEKELESILNSLYPNEYKFVGDGQIIINGKCPDFININGQKQIIELFGDYWHKGENPEDRAILFKPYGYETLVIWERELKNIEQVKNCIHKFHRNGVHS